MLYGFLVILLPQGCFSSLLKALHLLNIIGLANSVQTASLSHDWAILKVYYVSILGRSFQALGCSESFFIIAPWPYGQASFKSPLCGTGLFQAYL